MDQLILRINPKMMVMYNRKGTAPTRAGTSLFTGTQTIERQRFKIQIVRQEGRQSDGYGGWCLDLRREEGRDKRMTQDRIC